MKRMAVLLVAFVLLSGCAPSLQYRLGQGFYSEKFAKAQVQASANAGTVKNLGRFSTIAGGCFNYQQDYVDRNVIVPAIRAKLDEMGGNVADNVVANEKWYDIPLGILILPGFMACSNWEISGEALLVTGD